MKQLSIVPINTTISVTGTLGKFYTDDKQYHTIYLWTHTIYCIHNLLQSFSLVLAISQGSYNYILTNVFNISSFYTPKHVLIIHWFILCDGNF